MLQDLASGLVIGLAYALIALGLSVIFGVLRIINFAHGEFYMLGGLMLYSLTSQGFGFFPSLAGAVFGTMLVAIVIDWCVLKPAISRPCTRWRLAEISTRSDLRGVFSFAAAERSDAAALRCAL